MFAFHALNLILCNILCGTWTIKYATSILWFSCVRCCYKCVGVSRGINWLEQQSVFCWLAWIETLLLNINGITIHHRNIQTLMTELFKIKYDLAPPVMDSLLNRRTICYNFRNLQEFQSERKRTVFYGLETISYRAPQLWTILSEEFK